MKRALLTGLLALVSLPALAVPPVPTFLAFESGPVRPVALTPNGQYLLVTNIPDNRLEVFDVLAGGGLSRTFSIPVGMEPVAVAARTDTEVWVVNHLSDSVSVVDLAASPPRVVRTLIVGDEPRDIVFAGTGGTRAFITTAHRGQQRTDASIAAVTGCRRSAAHHAGRRPRRRLGVRCRQPRHHVRRHAAAHPDLLRRYAARARDRRHERLRRGVPFGKSEHHDPRGLRARRLRGRGCGHAAGKLPDPGRRPRRRARAGDELPAGRRRPRVRAERRRARDRRDRASSTARTGWTRSAGTGTARCPSRCPIATCSPSTRTPSRRERSTRASGRSCSTWPATRPTGRSTSPTPRART